jgi:hypothetical protein
MMTGAQALLLGAIAGSAIGVFAGSSHILPALRALRRQFLGRR